MKEPLWRSPLGDKLEKRILMPLPTVLGETMSQYDCYRNLLAMGSRDDKEEEAAAPIKPKDKNNKKKKHQKKKRMVV